MNKIKMTLLKISGLKRRYYSKKIRRKIGSTGNNFNVRKECMIHNGQYISIGDNFFAMPGCRIEAWDNYEGKNYNPIIKIGNDVSMNFDCHIGAIRYISIGNGVLFGSRVFITDHNHGSNLSSERDIQPNKRQLYSKGPVIIEDNVWIGEGAVILPNVIVGKGSIIGANAVVTKNVESYTIVGGNPARELKKM